MCRSAQSICCNTRPAGTTDMPMTWTPRPLTVGDGVIGAEGETPAQAAEAQRQRTARATPEMIAAAEQIAPSPKRASRRCSAASRCMSCGWRQAKRAGERP